VVFLDGKLVGKNADAYNSALSAAATLSFAAGALRTDAYVVR